MFVNDQVLGKLFKIGVLACNARNVWRPYDKLYFVEVGQQLFDLDAKQVEHWLMFDPAQEQLSEYVEAETLLVFDCLSPSSSASNLHGTNTDVNNMPSEQQLLLALKQIHLVLNNLVDGKPRDLMCNKAKNRDLM